MHRRGLLIAARTEHGLQAAAAMVEAARQAGYRGEAEVHIGAAVRRLEPALSEEVVGAVHSRADVHVRPESVLHGLRAALLAAGVELRGGVEVHGIERDGAHGWRVATGAGAVPADRVIIAAGVPSAALLRGLGVRISLLGGKGYSVTTTGTGVAPAHAIKMLEATIACSPFDAGVRISGRFELGARDERVRDRAVRSVQAGAARYLADWHPPHDRGSDRRAPSVHAGQPADHRRRSRAGRRSTWPPGTAPWGSPWRRRPRRHSRRWSCTAARRRGSSRSRPTASGPPGAPAAAGRSRPPRSVDHHQPAYTGRDAHGGHLIESPTQPGNSRHLGSTSARQNAMPSSTDSGPPRIVVERACTVPLLRIGAAHRRRRRFAHLVPVRQGPQVPFDGGRPPYTRARGRRADRVGVAGRRAGGWGVWPGRRVLMK